MSMSGLLWPYYAVLFVAKMAYVVMILDAMLMLGLIYKERRIEKALRWFLSFFILLTTNSPIVLR